MPTARAPITVEVAPINVKTNINVQPSTAAPIAPYQSPFNPNGLSRTCGDKHGLFK
ncbi:hypothetical protein [Kamptonema sp. UHCC 0994]|uniref:hypothetical protein n=1 Tax=Kamptonema sp. UHCC 0994 TaxID=3031329 RepID=UPI0023B8DB68|nr:hypothetical protein [Kamptonema sp. UHCC 0994]MDF0553885.1 hypothetical protein [Kamptonema sp. UHCC 0994]